MAISSYSAAEPLPPLDIIDLQIACVCVGYTRITLLV